MPTKKEHIEKARHNEQFFSSFNINTTPFLDWGVNGIFYAALHYIDSYLATNGENPGGHRERFELIQGDPNLGQLIFFHYRSLKDDCDGGRYDMKVFLPDEIRNDILPPLNSIKTHLKKFIPEI